MTSLARLFEVGDQVKHKYIPDCCAGSVVKSDPETGLVLVVWEDAVANGPQTYYISNLILILSSTKEEEERPQQPETD